MGKIKVCSLAHYRAIAATLPQPSDEQIAGYVDFVCDAHSWYKHLPFLPPGVPFVFFVDPYAGWDHVREASGELIYARKTEDSPRFHYTWMTTQEYQERFGHLTYDAAAGTSLVVCLDGAQREYGQQPIFGTSEGQYQIPPEVFQHGSVELTGIIHPFAGKSMLHWGKKSLTKDNGRSWPAATGGESTIRAIQSLMDRLAQLDAQYRAAYEPVYEAELSKLLAAEPSLHKPPPHMYAAARERAHSLTSDKWDEYYSHERELVALVNDVLMPEKHRLQQHMREAINRMLALVYD